MRAHFITLGVLTQLVLGLLPTLTAKGLNLPKPKMNWFSWLIYNGGLIILLIGLPVVNSAIIITGGTMIFLAVMVLMKDLIDLRRKAIAQMGRGSWWSLISMHLGGLMFWLGLFLPSIQALLRAGAFFFWFVAQLPMLLGLYAQAKAGTERMERASRRIVPGDTVQMD